MSIRRYVTPSARASRVAHDGPALMLSTAGAAASSLLFWVVAARGYPTDSVGEAAAEIAALTMLAGFAQLNLLSVFLRFLASAGNRVLRLLSSGYVAIGCASVVIGTTFVALGLGSGFLGGGWWEGTAFVLTVAVFAVFVVQDGVLTAFTKAPWVPIENLAVALARLALLGLAGPVALGAGDGSRLGIVGAWCLPTLLAVAVVSSVIFGRLAPQEVRWSPHGSLLPARRELTSFILAEYLNNTVSTVMAFVPPLLVLHLSGAEAAAYFNVPWLIVVVTQTLLWSIGMSFIVESTRRPGQIATHVRHTLRLGLIVVLGWTTALVVVAPILLGLQGERFSAQGTVLLRLLAITFPFTAVIMMYSLVAMLERRLRRLVVANTLGATAFVLAVVEVTPRSGIWSVGVIYLVVQAVLAAAFLPSLVGRLRGGGITLPETVVGPREAQQR